MSGARSAGRRLALAGALLLVASTTIAGGTVGGVGEALQNIGREGQRADIERERIELQHKLEMERMRREFQMQQQALEAQRLERVRQQAAAQTDRDRQMEAAHPGWVRTINTPDFKAWEAGQPQSVRRLAYSSELKDATLMLDLYKRDRPDWATNR